MSEQEPDPSSPWTHVQFDTSIVSSDSGSAHSYCIIFPAKPRASLLFSSLLQGTFVVELYFNHAPRTCYNMAALANQGYYDGYEK